VRLIVCLCFQFAAQEEKRQKNERLHQQQKHENHMRDLQLQCDANVRELQQLQVSILKRNYTKAPRLYLKRKKVHQLPVCVCLRTRSATC